MSQPTLATEFARVFTSYQAMNAKPKTLEAYRDSSRRLLAQLRIELRCEPTLAHFELDVVEEWLVSMLHEQPRLRPASIRSHVRRIRAISRRMHERGQIGSHRLAGLATPRFDPSELALFIPSSSEVLALLDACDRSTRTGRLDRALVAWFADSGPRRGELVSTDVDDFDGVGSVALRTPEKRGKPRFSPLGEVATAALSEYLGRRTSGPLFLAIGGGRLTGDATLARLARTSVAAGVERRIGPQLLRRFTATQVAATGSNQALLDAVMGWTSDPRKVPWASYIHFERDQLIAAFRPLSPVDRLAW